MPVDVVIGVWDVRALLNRIGMRPEDILAGNLMASIALRCVNTEDKIATLKIFVDDLWRQVQADGCSGDRAAVDAVAEQLIAQIVYPRVVDRICSDDGDRTR